MTYIRGAVVEGGFIDSTFGRSFNFVETHDDHASEKTDDRHASKAEIEEITDRFRLCNDLFGRLRNDITECIDARQQNRLADTGDCGLGDAGDRCGEAVRPESVGQFNVIQCFCQIGYHHKAGQAAEGFDHQRHQQNNEIIGTQQNHHAADRRNGESDDGYPLFSEFPHQRPENHDAIAHGALTHHIQKDLLSRALGDGAFQHPVAVVEHTAVGKVCGQMGKKGKGDDHHPVAVLQTGLDLPGKGHLLFPVFRGLPGCDPLIGKVILDQRGRQCHHGQAAHDRQPGAMGARAHTQMAHQQGHNHHGKSAGDHTGCGGGGHGQTVPLPGVPGGQGHHHGMAQRINGKCQREKEIVADDHPGDLHRVGGLGNGIQSDTAEGDQNTGKEYPGPSFTLCGACLVNEPAQKEADDGA